MPFALIPLLLLAVPVLEIAVFIIVGGQIGLWPTLGCILLTAVIGSFLLRVQGLAIVRRIQSELECGRVPGRDLGAGLMIVIAAVLLLTPGFVTDTLGFLLFVPAVRSWLWRLIASRLTVQVAGGRWTRGPGDSGPGRGAKVIELDAAEFSARGETGRDDISSDRRSR